jgi:hypothetical protein
VKWFSRFYYLINLKVIIMASAQSVKGSFSPVAGNGTRRVFDASNNFIGIIVKCSEGYRITRLDGKTRVKPTLAEAFRSIARSN